MILILLINAYWEAYVKTDRLRSDSYMLSCSGRAFLNLLRFWNVPKETRGKLSIALWKDTKDLLDSRRRQFRLTLSGDGLSVSMDGGCEFLVKLWENEDISVCQDTSKMEKLL